MTDKPFSRYDFLRTAGYALGASMTPELRIETNFSKAINTAELKNLDDLRVNFHNRSSFLVRTTVAPGETSSALFMENANERLGSAIDYSQGMKIEWLAEQRKPSTESAKTQDFESIEETLNPERENIVIELPGKKFRSLFVSSIGTMISEDASKILNNSDAIEAVYPLKGGVLAIYHIDRNGNKIPSYFQFDKFEFRKIEKGENEVFIELPDRNLMTLRTPEKDIILKIFQEGQAPMFGGQDTDLLLKSADGNPVVLGMGDSLGHFRIKNVQTPVIDSTRFMFEFKSDKAFADPLYLNADHDNLVALVNSGAIELIATSDEGQMSEFKNFKGEKIPMGLIYAAYKDKIMPWIWVVGDANTPKVELSEDSSLDKLMKLHGLTSVVSSQLHS